VATDELTERVKSAVARAQEKLAAAGPTGWRAAISQEEAECAVVSA
jgi:hypothetical protein